MVNDFHTVILVLMFSQVMTYIAIIGLIRRLNKIEKKESNE